MSQHWYCNETGEPRYTVVGSNNKERPTTLRDARKLNLVPSVTTIMGVADKPGLTEWKTQQVLDACWQNPFIPGNCVNTWKQEIRKISSNVAKDASEEGTKIHDILEGYFLGKKIPVDYLDLLYPVIELLKEEFGLIDWIAEESFATDGFGGKIDLHCKDGIILDFKTKLTTDPKKLVAYDEYIMQLAAYRHGLGLPKAKCYNLFISTKKPGLVKLHKWTEEQTQRGWEMFSTLKNYWYLHSGL